MTRRNFILLLIGLIIITILFVWLFYSQRAPAPGRGTGPDTGFDWNPFDGVTTVPPKEPPVVPTEPTPPTEEEVKEMRLIKVSSMPIAGYTVFQKERELGKFASALRYVARENGNIFETLVEKITEVRFSKTVILKVYEAFLGNNGESVIMRYIKNDERTIQSFISTLPKESFGDGITDREIKGEFLPENISDLTLSPDRTRVFYLIENSGGVTGVILNFKDNKKTQVFDSPFSEWLSYWPTTKMITLSTKPSGLLTGQIYILNPDTKDLSRIFGEMSGLTTLASPTGRLVLLGDSGPALNVYEIGTRETGPVGLSGLPEKCVWAKSSSILYCAIPKFIDNGLYPDDWYKGVVSFEDEIWKIDLENEITTKIIDPLQTEWAEDIDAIKLSLDSREENLFFVNKKDSYLWQLKLK